MYCLDTNILIFDLKSINQDLSRKVEKGILEGQIVLTSITWSEFLYYPHKHNSEKILNLRKEILLQFPVLDFDSKAAELFAFHKDYLEKIGRKIEEFDLMIASICLANDLTLITHNLKHFQNIEGLKVEDWF